MLLKIRVLRPRMGHPPATGLTTRPKSVHKIDANIIFGLSKITRIKKDLKKLKNASQKIHDNRMIPYYQHSKKQ